MGVPAFYRWLSEKYPKIVQDVLEERVKLKYPITGNDNDVKIIKQEYDCTKPNPSELETDNLYIDMNGIIHPCSHPEIGKQPSCEEEMYENITKYIDRLFRVVRPRRLLYLAIDGVAPRAKMNQQRSRRFRSAQEAREHDDIELIVKKELGLVSGTDNNPIKKKKKVWDSNVITPGTKFMLNLSTYIKYYIKKRISEDKAWKTIKIIFSDASIPGEGEHKIMNHIRRQRTISGYNPNLIHVLHGLDADLIMLALATHETHFYILRELVTFGRKSIEATERRQLETGFKDKQKALDDDANINGYNSMEYLIENQHKPLQRISIPILREYLSVEFTSLLRMGYGLERIIDDVVFLCFFVGNDFLPHLPSLDIRDGALDFLYNVYKKILPTIQQKSSSSVKTYITSHGGNVNLSAVDLILKEVGDIEDYVFQLKYDNEKRNEEYKKNLKEKRKTNSQQKSQIEGQILKQHYENDQREQQQNGNNGNTVVVKGRAARILEKRQKQGGSNDIPLGRGKQDERTRMKQADQDAKVSSAIIVKDKIDNIKAAELLKKSLLRGTTSSKDKDDDDDCDDGASSGRADKDKKDKDINEEETKKRKIDSIIQNEENEKEEEDEKEEEKKSDNNNNDKKESTNSKVGNVDEDDNIGDEDDDDDDDDDDDVEDEDDPDKVIENEADELLKEEVDEIMDEETKKLFKEKVKAIKEKQLDEYAKNVNDKVRLHEKGWKDRYYTDKCKADDIKNHGGREYLFKSYIMGLCWVMKYYYDGCPSWKWYYPFHYAPFASDLRNVERFTNDCKSFEINEPFKPVEQLMAVLPSDSCHAIPKESRFLMLEPTSPIIDFYPSDVPCDPNGKAMPWLWVVLLPFINEERLLNAMHPTMDKWTTKEKLCNERGLDDGYLYVHSSHPLSNQLSNIYSNTMKSKLTTPPKVSSNEGSIGSGGQYEVFGSIRLPLSTEICNSNNHNNNDDNDDNGGNKDDSNKHNNETVSITIEPIKSALRKKSSLTTNVFTEPIQNGQDILCVAFTEPSKLSHKSIMLPGSKPPPPSLVSYEDKKIKRPRLNRGGSTIAFMGGANTSDAINGPGQQQIGTRKWGSLEPTNNHKRQRYDNYQQQQQQPYQHQQQPPYQPNPFQQQPLYQQQQQQQQQQHGYNNRPPPWQNQQQGTYVGGYHQQQQQQQQQYHQQPWQQAPPPPPPPQQHYNQPPPPPPPPPPPTQHQRYHGGYQQQQQPQQHGGYRGQHHQRHQPPPHHQQQQQQRQGFSFNNRQQQRNNNNNNNRVNSNVMSSLRSQLASTLNKNRQKGGGR